MLGRCFYGARGVDDHSSPKVNVETTYSYHEITMGDVSKLELNAFESYE